MHNFFFLACFKHNSAVDGNNIGIDILLRRGKTAETSFLGNETVAGSQIGHRGAKRRTGKWMSLSNIYTQVVCPKAKAFMK